MKHPNVDIDSEESVQSPEDTSFGDILSQFEQTHGGEPHAGQALQGTVVAINDEFAVVDIGRKTEGVIPLEKLRSPAGELTAKVGDGLLVNVTGRNQEGYYELSTIRVERPKDWSSLESAFADHRTIAGMVAEAIKGGLRVDVGVRAFLPASRSGARDASELEKLVGQEIRCRITKLDVAKEDVVVDRRIVLEEEERAARAAVFEGIHEGAVLRGTVRSLMDFGAFIDIGWVDGLLHVTDIAWTRIAKPADVLSVGETVEVKVLKVNAQTRKISLGMKQLVPDQWTTASQKFKVGDRVRGKVARLTDFGAFVELEPGVDGLIHV
ncbi:MAG: 30S ribosomal protein S1, partial [Bryobacteraceae bacterium]